VGEYHNIMARKKFGEFSTGHNCKCSKTSCRESEAASVRELSKEYPEYESLLKSWNGGSSNFICSQCWMKDIEEKYEEKKSISSCDVCYKNFKNGDNYYTITREGKKKAFCSKNCANKFKEDLKETKRKKQEHYANIAREWKEKEWENTIKQLIESLSNDMENDKDISHYQWETADWLSDEQKQICRDYVKIWREKKDLENKKEQLEQENNNYSDHSDNSNDEEKCAECGKGETKYRNKETNDGKEFCSQDCFINYYKRKQSSTTNSSNNTEEPCDKCNLTSSSNGKFYTIYGKGNYCNDCADKLLKKDNSSSDDNSDDKDKPIRKKNIKKLVDDKIWENLKRMVKSGEKSAGEIIDEYELSSEQKRELHDYESNNEFGQPKPFYRQPWVIIGVVIILLIPLILIVKNTKGKKKRK